MRLDELRTQALRYLALADYPRALTVYERILARLPGDLETRMRIADVLTQIGQRDLAQRVYAAVAYLDIQGGRPLHGLVAMQALADLGQEIAPLRLALAQIYGAGSPRLAAPSEGRVGSRLAPPAPDAMIDPPETLADPRHPPELEAAALAAASVAADLRTVADFPTAFPPVPLLSDLTDQAFARLLEAVTVQRLGHGALVVRAGETGEAFYFLAAGAVRVFTTDGTVQRELGRLHEGAVFGEMALVHAEPRAASVEVLGSADLLVVTSRSLKAVAAELPAIAAALDRFTRDRLLKNLLATSPLFGPFTPAQRLDLLRRFTGHDVAPETAIVREGEVGQGLYLLLTGEAEVRRASASDGKPLAILHPGECFGEISLLRAQPAMATVTATRPSTVLFLAREYFHRLIEAVPEMRAWFAQLTEERLREAGLAPRSSDDSLVDAQFDTSFLL